jgi:hypothetical protein
LKNGGAFGLPLFFAEIGDIHDEGFHDRDSSRRNTSPPALGGFGNAVLRGMA